MAETIVLRDIVADHRRVYHGHSAPMIVGEVMILDGEYDPAQLWLPCLPPVVFNAVAPPIPQTVSRKAIRAALAPYRYVRIPCERQFGYLMTADQYPLPFRLRLTEEQFSQIRRVGFPLWDRDSVGEIWCLKIKKQAGTHSHMNDALVMLQRDCRRLWYYWKGNVQFSSARDAKMAHDALLNLGFQVYRPPPQSEGFD